MHRFPFIGSYSFCTFRSIQVLDALLNKICKTHSFNQLSPLCFWRNLHLFEYQKRPNRTINKIVTEFVKLLGGQLFVFRLVFFSSGAHLKLGAGLATQIQGIEPQTK